MGSYILLANDDAFVSVSADWRDEQMDALVGLLVDGRIPDPIRSTSATYGPPNAAYLSELARAAGLSDREASWPVSLRRQQQWSSRCGALASVLSTVAAPILRGAASPG